MVDMIKVTFTLDEATVDQLRRTAARVRKPQSRVVREAIGEYATRVAKLSEDERHRMLTVLDRAMRRPPSRPAAEVGVELREIRTARRRWRARRRLSKPA
jgi:Ribbon-helix-helix protein, copG family